MREPSRKIIDKQIRRYGLGELDDVPCLVKYCKKLIKSWEQQGYVRISGPFYYLNKRDWIARGRELGRDIRFAVKKKPGRRYNNDRKGRKALRLARHQRMKAAKSEAFPRRTMQRVYVVNTAVLGLSRVEIEELKKEYNCYFAPQCCQVRDREGNSCPGVARFRKKPQAWLCDQCYAGLRARGLA